jgi:glycosyltransferase involved in cell wall biosynthesis
MSREHRPAIAILGSRGIPACHGGFETFAERLAVHLVQRGWDVEVYCQDGNDPDDPCPEEYMGVKLRRLRIGQKGPLGTLLFDWKTMRQAASGPPRLLLTLGYNCGVFAALPWLQGRINLVNMDGLEWKRQKWSPPLRAWLWCNERLACWFHNHLIADHPAIADHLATRVARRHITTIPYGADRVDAADPAPLAALGVTAGDYALVIARPVPENSILEVVRAFSSRRRGMQLVVLGHIRPEYGAYPRALLAAASDEVVFPGAIYDAPTLAALRVHCRLYVHGHQVGGTNPSLVEALGAGSAVLAHDNVFNRWVAGPGASYFTDEAGCTRAMDELLAAPAAALQAMGAASRARHAAMFTWTSALTRYEVLLSHWWQRMPGRKPLANEVISTAAAAE